MYALCRYYTRRIHHYNYLATISPRRLSRVTILFHVTDSSGVSPCRKVILWEAFVGTLIAYTVPKHSFLDQPCPLAGKCLLILELIGGLSNEFCIWPNITQPVSFSLEAPLTVASCLALASSSTGALAMQFRWPKKHNEKQSRTAAGLSNDFKQLLFLFSAAVILIVSRHPLTRERFSNMMYGLLKTQLKRKAIIQSTKTYGVEATTLLERAEA